MMRQLFKEGWIPYVARQAVGCFLTRGALWICWEEGFKVSVIIILLFRSMTWPAGFQQLPGCADRVNP